MTTIEYSLSEIDSAAKDLIKYAGEDRIWIFQGQMGAGKTTLIRALSKAFNVEDEISSPTFGIVNEYHSSVVGKIYHFDFYRLDDPDEALDIGIEEYFYSGNHCWIEWAEKISPYIPEEFVLIKIEIIAEDRRKIHIQKTQDAY
ncbi:tRNA (adenosine(37)-N6)-threonylcarbamoyltransferase complex ATPase subunit type 1 TsaE [Algoriphagus sp. oki45]|uniref:tRNA (adenosine(37)-N6)-threonylcarbamoyltransferase complex ATPase subunit type 1 TsaE n=1 Tax=Algoriphagus sp. oki45 TaxID=3067294 RepID=UPI0027F5E5D4|nr:tRNA (adenosine(37)-N6)-threonylcarbamoyltransferase complex ATPase subunit type 1 TsaE [Algoriphagus sp. oki45]